MNTLKTRKTAKGNVYFLAENGKIVNSISFVEYAAFEGLYTVNKVEGDYYTFLPTTDGNKTYTKLADILDKGYIVYLVS